MPTSMPLPSLWLISDARNDARLDGLVARMGGGLRMGLIYRHYHLPPAARRARFAVLARAARARAMPVVLAGPMAQARRWGADGAYGAAATIGPGAAGLRLVTAHGLRELALARRARADLVLLSPVWPTRSHPGGKVLGLLRFALMARRAAVPVIALGGVTAARGRAARGCGAHGWAAIDGIGAVLPRRAPRRS